MTRRRWCVFLLLAGFPASAALLPHRVRATEPDPGSRCAAARDDDTVRPYAPELRAGLLRAYTQLFPRARTPPDEKQLQATANLRCMDGRLFACFTGANLPCSKLNTARINIGADSYCRRHPDAAVVPAFAVGHDTAYVYRCIAGRPSISRRAFPLDARGFAAPLWAPTD